MASSLDVVVELLADSDANDDDDGNEKLDDEMACFNAAMFMTSQKFGVVQRVGRVGDLNCL